ncbi:hypothetical protein N0V84_011311 [Fusarium piperis]|uniref:Uncharacterized protein n=1 Tax=Fusarium piperis TaxID=1435070 RepID=A0A9W8TBG3_9HYPO|nr:hypothetical protein N0V84_011311 [Fusarium piperis]
MAKREPEMPMPGGDEQLRLIDTLENSQSLYELCLELPKLAESLDQNPVLKANGFGVSDTVKAFRQDIIQGTVAHDLSRLGQNGWYNTPLESEGKVAGVYAVGICRAGKGGKFVDIHEMRKLIQGMKQYIRGYQALAKHLQDVDVKAVVYGDMANLSREDISDMAWVSRVDEDRTKFFKGKPRARAQFITKDEEVPIIQALVRTYERMCLPEITEAEEAIRMRQSPVYVGCSSDIRSRTSIYRGSSLKPLSKPMGLTLAILNANKTPGQMRVGVALRIWKPDQLALAEQLVATLAGSLVYQHGFNAIETGGTGSNTVRTPDTLERSRRDIMLRGCELADNVKDTIHELETREDFLKKLGELEREIPEVNRRIERLAESVAQLPAGPDFDSLIDETTELIQHRQQELRDTKEALEQWDIIIDIKRKLLGFTEKDIA